MKKVLASTLAIGLLAGATLSFAGMPARTGVNGSFHDMNSYAPTKGGNQDQYNRVCVFCHTPHNATTDDGQLNPLPLWGNNITTKTQDPYQWATPLNADNLTISDALVGPSRLCMTCHDGTIAIDAHISNGQLNNGTLKLSGSRAIGSNDSLLTKTHPIGFDYIAAKNARNINGQQEVVDESSTFATAITPSTVAGTYNDVTRAGTRTIKSVLYGGKTMTCATCHEVHNKENVVQDPAVTGATANYFLYAKESNSLICLSCHIK